jgi:hypothetical protein|tara:strand:- start:423 stop:617 length:195 start_codon:yes stop_codon:yes gene_type:complete
MVLNKKGSSVGVIAKGLVIKGQGKVPYNGPEVVDTPQVATGKTTKGTISKGGMGAMLRGGTFTY